MDSRSAVPRHSVDQPITDSCSSASPNRDEISDFDNLKENLRQKLKLENWFLLTSHQDLHIFNVQKKSNGNLSIRNTIFIDIELAVKVYGANDDELFCLRLYRWPQLQSVIEQFSRNVKREDEVSITGSTEMVRGDYGNGQGKDAVTFEFCATNTESETTDLHQPLNSTVKVEPTNDAVDPQSAFIHDAPPHICSACDRAFDQKDKLIAHTRSDHEPQTCLVCKESFIGTMDRHMRLHFNGKSFQCHICDRKYVMLHSLGKHMQSKHLGARDGSDDIETKNDNNEKSESKKRSRNNKGPKFVDEENDRSDSKDPNQWMRRCTVCDKEFFTKIQFINHKYRHDRTKWKECPICNKSYGNLRRHLNDVHNKIKNQVCHICGASYKQAATLKEHIEVKHSHGEEFFCDICNNGKNFFCKANMRRHMSKVHVKISQPKKPFYECRLCHEHLPSIYTLKKHVTLMHRNGKVNELQLPRFRCRFCDKTFKLKQSCTIHEKLHAGKTHVCTDCGQSFNHPNYLRKHRRRHKVIKHRECTLCDKRYVENVDLRL